MSCRYFVIKLRRQARVLFACGLLCTIIIIVFLSICGSETDKEEVIEYGNSAETVDSSSHKYSLNTNLIIIVISAPGNREKRNAIRRTWASNLPNGSVVRFVVGTKDLSGLILSSITEETAAFKDLIILPDFLDSYGSLTSKLLSTIQWVFQNVKFNFFMKVDEDSFVRADKVLYSLLDKPHTRLYWGFFDGRAHVKKNGKWSEKDFVLCDRYLPYALGGGYVLSKDLVEYLSTNAKYFKLFRSEDVSLGTWLAPLDINRVHDTTFDTEYKSRGCFNSYIVTHKKSAEQMSELQNNLQTKKQLCTTEIRERLSYEYNWNELPTSCCKRVDPLVP